MASLSGAGELKVTVDTTEIDEALAKVLILKQAIEDVLATLPQLRELEGKVDLVDRSKKPKWTGSS